MRLPVLANACPGFQVAVVSRVPSGEPPEEPEALDLFTDALAQLNSRLLPSRHGIGQRI